MARYFFHLRDGERLLADEEGEELRDLGAVRSYAIDSARQLLSQAGTQWKGWQPPSAN